MKKLIASLVIAATAALVHAGYESESLTGYGFTGHAFFVNASAYCVADSYGAGSAQIHMSSGASTVSYGQGRLTGTRPAGSYYIYCAGNSPSDYSTCSVSW